MLALGIRYLNGFVVASHGRYEQVEWPPHPGRVFMAMVAAHYQTGADPAERQALHWLEEELPAPPEVHVPEHCPRTTVTQYVPVNDDPSQFTKKQGKISFYQEIQGTPFRRNRQERTFARAWLAEDMAFLHWPQAEPPAPVRQALESLCGKVSRIGHSSSLVQMWLAEAVPPGLLRWVPDDDHPTRQMRVIIRGTLAALDDDFRRRTDVRGKRPLAEQGYARADESMPVRPVVGTVFSVHMLVFMLERLDGPYRHLDLACTLALTDAWRKALVSQGNDLSDESRQIISGHATDGRRMERPHLAFLPLPVVGHEHADGHLMGVAIALPNELPAEVRLEVLKAVGRVNELILGRLGRWRLEQPLMARPPVTIQTPTWTAHPQGATHWSTVTPFAFDQHPKAKGKTTYQQEAADLIDDACERIGLPRAREVIVTSVSSHLGVPPAHAFPRLLRKDASERRHTHAILVFDQPIRGPVLLGAGRYRGYGLFRPMEAET